MSDKIEERLTKMEENIRKVLEKIKPIPEINHNMKTLNGKMESLKGMEKQVGELQESYNFFNESFEVFTKKFEANMKEMKNTKITLHKVEADNEKLRKETRDLRIAITDLQSGALQTQAEIVGIPQRQGESLYGIVAVISKKIDMTVEQKDIISVRRLNNKSGRTPVIHIVFADREKRQTFLMKGKKARLNTQDVGIPDIQTSIYINECLSYITKEVLFKARKVKIEQKWKYLWVKENKIYMRKDDASKAIRIVDHTDLETIQK